MGALTRGGEQPWVTPRSSRSAPAASPAAAPATTKPSSNSRSLAAKSPGPRAPPRPTARAAPASDRPRLRSRPKPPADGVRRAGPQAATLAAEPEPPAEQPARPRPADAPDDCPTRCPGHRRPPPPDSRHPAAGVARRVDLRRPRSCSATTGSRASREFLAFLRRRLTGDYAVDDYGFDQEITERFMLAAHPPDRAEVVPRRGARGREHPGRGWRARGLQPLRHASRSTG